MKRSSARFIFLIVLLAATLALFFLHKSFPALRHELLDRLRPRHPAFVEKSEDEMTEEEREVKRALEKELRDNAPTHRLILDGNQTMTGRLVEEKPNYVVFSESYRDTGWLSMKIARSRVDKIEVLTNTLPAVTYRDVLFKMEFPNMNLYKRPPYTIMTDECYFRVQNTVNLLQKLYQQMFMKFGVLMDRGKERKNIQVLFFSKESDFVPYRNRHASCLKGSVGFYSGQLDRLIVFNQKSATELREGMARLDAEVSKYQGSANTPQARASLKQWKKKHQQRIINIAKEETLRTIRHEGSHQIFYDLGVHSYLQPGHAWAIEGMATYCETDPVGDINPGRTYDLRIALRDGNLIPLEKLLGLPNLESSLAYSESWALTCFLMRAPFRKGFFDYLRFLRDTANSREIKREPPLELLCRFLEMDPKIFEEQWLEYIPCL